MSASPLSTDELAFVASQQAALAEYAAPNISAGDSSPAGSNEDTPAATPPVGISVDMPLAWLMPSSFNPRRTFDEESLQQLAESIRQHGLLEPIVVREVQAPADWSVRVVDAAGNTCPTYEVIAGERRYRACRMAKLETVPVRVLADVNDKLALQLALIENLQRQDLDPLEEARGYAALRDLAGMTQVQIAAAVKRSQPAVAKALGLLKLPEAVQQLIRDGKLTASHGELLTRLPAAFPAIVSAAAASAAERAFTTRQLEQQPLGYEYDLVQHGVLHRLAGASFDVSVCDACPFGAKLGTDRWSSYCLKPEHFAELEAAHKKEEQRAKNRAIQEAKRNGATVPELRNLPYDSYQKLDRDVPAGCTETCECRGKAIGYDGELVAICTKPGHYRALQGQTTRTSRKSQREVNAAHVAALAAHLQAAEAITSEMLAPLLWAAVERVKEHAWTVAAARHVPGLMPEKHRAGGGAGPSDLARLAPLDMVRFVLDAVVTQELEHHIEATWETPATWNFYEPFVAPLPRTDAVKAQAPCMACGTLTTHLYLDRPMCEACDRKRLEKAG